MTENQTLLVCLAHPDDEILSSGGTIATLAGRGVRVVLVCATRGEAGQIARPELATPETLGAVREQELLCAARQLGIAEVIFLDYLDSGMAGSSENERPEAFINAPAEEIISHLQQIMRRTKPQVVLTFAPYGGYGHPDHITIHQHTVAAFDALTADSWQPRRLVYQLIPTFFFEQMRDMIAAHGGDVSDFDLTEHQGKRWPDDQIHFIVDVTEQVKAKEAAWNCHATQFGPNSRFRRLPREAMMQLLSKEYFALAQPEPAPGLLYNDLFASL